MYKPHLCFKGAVLYGLLKSHTVSISHQTGFLVLRFAKALQFLFPHKTLGPFGWPCRRHVFHAKEAISKTIKFPNIGSCFHLAAMVNITWCYNAVYVVMLHHTLVMWPPGSDRGCGVEEDDPALPPVWHQGVCGVPPDHSLVSLPRLSPGGPDYHTQWHARRRPATNHRSLRQRTLLLLVCTQV